MHTGEQLRRHRFRAGLTQQELAGRARISIRALRSIEQGHVRSPQAGSVRRLAAALGLTGTDLDRLIAHDEPVAGPTGTDVVEVLGPLRLRRTGVDPAMVRTLLGLLAVQPGQVVGVPEIIEVLWDDQPPRTCGQLVLTYVAALRRVLEPGRPQGSTPSLLCRVGTGYRLDADTDVRRLRTLLRAAADAEGRAAMESLGCGLALWRGPVAADCGTRLRQHPAAVALGEERVRAALRYTDLAVEAGNGDRAVGPLRGLAAQEPLHEGIAARLMTALASTGDQAAALSVYDTIRRSLDEELGVLPGEELRTVHRRVLQGGDEPVPAQLPADVPAFVGRDDLLRRLDEYFSGVPGGVVSLSTLDGMGGVGKTALAVHWGHAARRRYPDGQLYVDLRGHAQGGRPVPPLEALAGFLLALGVPAETIPDTPERAAALFRTTVSGRRLIIVLDNAADARQVRPLLPGTDGCAVLVTSRNRIAGLVARDGARQVTVDVLSPADADALLRRMVGTARCDAEPAAVADLVRLCACLPLALRIAAANLVARPRHRIADHVAKLAAGNRLAALRVTGDADAAVQAAFDLSYAALPPAERRVFHALGLFPGPDATAAVIAALTGIAPDECEDLLQRLADRHLADEPAPGRYTMHDLVGLYAADRATAAERREHTDRLAGYYCGHGDEACRLVNPHLLRAPGEPFPVPHVWSAVGPALAWLDAERATLVCVVPHLAAAGRTTEAWRLADTLQAYLRVRLNPADWEAVCQAALAAAQAEGSPVAQASAHLNLGSLYDFRSCVPLTAEHFTRAREFARQAGWTQCEAVAVNNLARGHWLAGRPQETIDQLEEALLLHRRAGRAAGEAVTLANIGTAHGELALRAGITTAAGRIALHCAVTYAERALALHRAIDDRGNEADTLRRLATFHRDLGDTGLALRLAAEAVRLNREVHNRRFEAVAVNSLATVYARLGDSAEAMTRHREALATVRDLEDRHLEAQILLDIAETCVAAGDHGAAADAMASAAPLLGVALLARQAAAVRAALDAALRQS